jgi:hypothetical protein
MRLGGWRHQTLTQVAQARPAPQNPFRFECPVRKPSARPDEGGIRGFRDCSAGRCAAGTLRRYRSLGESPRWRRRVPRRRTRFALNAPFRKPSARPDEGGTRGFRDCSAGRCAARRCRATNPLRESPRWRRRVPRRRTRLALTDPVRVPRFHPDAGGHPRISRLFRRSVRSGDAAALPIPRENHPGGAGASRAA